MEKLAFSCCGSEEFMRAVKELRRQRILLCGIEAHVCAQQTAIDLMKDYFVYVAVDAIGSRRDEDRVVAIERIRDCGAVITTVESAVFELLREAGTDQFKQILPLFK
jgi:nicotinamidase-related amidase